MTSPLSAQYDVVVVGAGSHSLTTAGFLGKMGKKVLVLEKNAVCGGGPALRSPAPGFVGDPLSHGLGVCLRNPVISHDELGLSARFGLKWVAAEAHFATVFDDGSSLITYPDLHRTCEQIAKFSLRDAEAYRALAHQGRQLLPLLLHGFYAPPLPFNGFMAQWEQAAQGRALGQALFASAFDVVTDSFESPELRMHLLKWVGTQGVAPEAKGSGVVPLRLMALAHDAPASTVVGGSAQLMAALEHCVQQQGGEIRTHSEVVRLKVSAGRATGVVLHSGEVVLAKDAVVANLHPWDLASFIPGVDPALAQAARRVRLSPHGAIHQHYALSEAPIWKAGADLAPSLRVECQPRDVKALRQSFDAYRDGEMPLQHLSPGVAVPSRQDPSRAPAGQASVHLHHLAPLALAEGGMAGWEAIKDDAADAIFEAFCQYTTNIDASKVIGRVVTTPWDQHRHSLTQRHGDALGVGMELAQSWGRRPLPELAQHRVPPIEALYLDGPSQHPGGPLSLGGRATAMKMMTDWKMDLKRAFAVV